MNYAHWHLMLNHFPVIGMIFGVVLWFLAMRTGQAILYKTALGWFIGLAALAVAVYFTGQNSHEMLHGLPGVGHDIIDVHEQWGTYTLIASVITGILSLVGFLQIKKSGQFSPVLKALIPLFVVITTGIVLFTAHLGGQIRHTEIRPGFVPVEEGTDGHGGHQHGQSHQHSHAHGEHDTKIQPGSVPAHEETEEVEKQGEHSDHHSHSQQHSEDNNHG